MTKRRTPPGRKQAGAKPASAPKVKKKAKPKKQAIRKVSKPARDPVFEFTEKVKKAAKVKGSIGHPRPATKERPKSIFSRPAAFPKVKDDVRGILDGLDDIGQALKEESLRKTGKWLIKTGAKDTVWVAHIRITGIWDYSDLRKVFLDFWKNPPIDDQHFAFASFHYQETNSDGEVEVEGWFCPSGATMFGVLCRRIAHEFDERVNHSYASRYKHSRLTGITLSVGSKLIRPAFLDEE